MGKLGVTQLKMYENMIMDDFAPLITILQARTAGMEESIRIQVKKELGIYDLLEEKTVLEERLKEIDRKTKKLTEPYYHNIPHKGREFFSELDQHVFSKLDEINHELTTAKNARGQLVRKIRLAGVIDSIRETFDEAGKVIIELTQEAKTLPPIKIINEQIT